MGNGIKESSWKETRGNFGSSPIDPLRSKEEMNVNPILDKILALTRTGFFGKLHLTFENGKIVHGVEERAIKF